MARRGYDLSGDLRIDHDPLYESISPFSNLVVFSVLAVAALIYRQKPEIHKRLMLFANIELMPAPLAHLIGHNPCLATPADSHHHDSYLGVGGRHGRARCTNGRASSPAHVWTGAFSPLHRAD